MQNRLASLSMISFHYDFLIDPVVDILWANQMCKIKCDDKCSNRRLQCDLTKKIFHFFEKCELEIYL